MTPPFFFIPIQTEESTAASTPKNGHLAVSGAEDYFRAVNQGTELDDGMDQGNLGNQSNTVNGAQSITKRKRDGDDGDDDEDEDEESRYSVEKKDGKSKKSSWNEQVSASRTTGEGANGSDSDMSISSNSEERDSGVGDEEDEVSSDGSDMLEDSDEDALDEHVLDIGSSTENIDGTDNNYDLNTELGHLDDVDFKVLNSR